MTGTLRTLITGVAALLLAMPAIGQKQAQRNTALHVSNQPQVTKDASLAYNSGQDALRGGGPINDECAGAISLTVGSSCMTITSNSSGATESLPAAACSGFTASAAEDVWFSFMATAEASQVEVTGSEDYDPIVEVFTGTCGDLTSLGCSDATLAGGIELMSMTTIPGNTYYVRVYHWPYMEPPSSYDFDICVVGGTAPANDFCDDVTPLALTEGGQLDFSGTTTLATSDGDAEPGSAAEGLNPVVWHAFTISECLDVTVDYCGTDPTFGNVYIVLSSSCPAADDLVAASTNTTETCGDDNLSMLFLALPAGTYYIPVGLFPNANGPYSLQVSAGPCTELANDECDGATELTPAATCNWTSGDILGATESLPAIECNTFTGTAGDVWYSFEATQTSMTVRVQGNGDFDAVIDLRDGTCATSTSIGCSDWTLEGGQEEVVAESLTVGTTYYVRVYDWYASLPDDTTFDICVMEGAQPNSVGEVSAGDLTWTVYPNPGNGQFNLQWGDRDANAIIELLDVSGRLVHDMRMTLSNGGVHALDLQGVAQGRYILRLTTSEGISQQLLLVN